MKNDLVKIALYSDYRDAKSVVAHLLMEGLRENKIIDRVSLVGSVDTAIDILDECLRRYPRKGKVRDELVRDREWLLGLKQ